MQLNVNLVFLICRLNRMSRSPRAVCAPVSYTHLVNWIVGEGYEETGLHGIYWLWSAKFLFEGSTSLNDTTHASLNACSSAPTAMMLMKLIGVMDDPALEGKFDGLLDDWMLKAQNIYEFCYMTVSYTHLPPAKF